jgi:hypothetical protein
VAVWAEAEPGGELVLQVPQDGVEAQGCPAAFGRVSRSWVRSSWAVVARVTWRCQPIQDRVLRQNCSHLV